VNGETQVDLKLFIDVPPWEWPKNAGRIFLKVLTDKAASPADRLVAADLAGDMVVMNNSLADALMAVVADPGEPTDLRAKAAISFGPVLEEADTMGFDDPDDVPISLVTFHKIQEMLRATYNDEANPKYVRRRVLEASVRASQDWHPFAISECYATGDPEWVLTAVFCMQYVRGFDRQIMESLHNPDPEIHAEAVVAAGNGELAEAWPHVVDLVGKPRTPKPLLLAAIQAVASIRPAEAPRILADLALSKDEEIAEAAGEAIAIADGYSEYGSELEDDEDEDTEWIN
jgi:hypothetical protein